MHTQWDWCCCGGGSTLCPAWTGNLTAITTVPKTIPWEPWGGPLAYPARKFCFAPTGGATASPGNRWIHVPGHMGTALASLFYAQAATPKFMADEPRIAYCALEWKWVEEQQLWLRDRHEYDSVVSAHTFMSPTDIEFPYYVGFLDPPGPPPVFVAYEQQGFTGGGLLQLASSPRVQLQRRTFRRATTAQQPYVTQASLQNRILDGVVTGGIDPTPHNFVDHNQNSYGVNDLDEVLQSRYLNSVPAEFLDFDPPNVTAPHWAEVNSSPVTNLAGQVARVYRWFRLPVTQAIQSGTGQNVGVRLSPSIHFVRIEFTLRPGGHLAQATWSAIRVPNNSPGYSDVRWDAARAFTRREPVDYEMWNLLFSLEPNVTFPNASQYVPNAWGFTSFPSALIRTRNVGTIGGPFTPRMVFQINMPSGNWLTMQEYQPGTDYNFRIEMEPPETESGTMKRRVWINDVLYTPNTPAFQYNHNFANRCHGLMTSIECQSASASPGWISPITLSYVER